MSAGSPVNSTSAIHLCATRQGGVTLVELMVALTIGLIILAGVAQLFVTSRATYTMEEGVGRAQEAGRFAMEYLTQDIRMAGYAGCHSPSSAGTVQGNGAGTTCTTSLCNLANPADPSTVLSGAGLLGYTYTGTGTSNLNDWSPALPSAYFTDGEVKAYTDVILIQYAVSTGTHLTGNVTPDNANVQFSDTSPIVGQIQPDDIIIISDCKSTDVFRASGVSTPGGSGKITISHASTNNLSSHLSHMYGNDAEILTLSSRVYYIGVNNGEPGLRRKELQSGGSVSAGQELVQGIEDMRAIYGVDTDSTYGAERYVLAHRVVDLNGLGTTTWDNVQTVRIGLLIHTPSGVDNVKDTNIYELVDGISVGPANDNRRRQVYKATVQLRN